jgi:hypothetical protein
MSCPMEAFGPDKMRGPAVLVYAAVKNAAFPKPNRKSPDHRQTETDASATSFFF